MPLRKMSLRARLILGFGLVIVLLVVVASTSLLRLRAFNQSVEEVVSARLPKIVTAGAWEAALLQTARQMRDVLILDDEKQIKASLRGVQQGKQEVSDLSSTIEKKLAPGQETELFQSIVETRKQYDPAADEFLKIAERGNFSEAKDIMLERVRPAQLKYLEAIKHFSNHEIETSAQEGHSVEAAYATTSTLLLALTLLAVCCGSVAAWLIIRSLLKQLGGEPTYAVAVVSRIANGDLNSEVVTRADDTTSLLAAMRAMQQNLVEVVTQIKETSSDVALAAQQLASASEQLSSGAQTQAASLEETAASLEEMSGAVQQNADNSQQAKQLAVGSRDTAEQGGHVVHSAVSAMAEINKSSKKIADIITTIDEIAFQTNLLALNAAVEAARAGEQGRGFAVVAAEVRNLAQRSATAAKEIKILIQDSVEKVAGGSALVNESGQTLHGIVASFKQVTDLIAEIATASQAQSEGVGQINKAVTQMDQLTQANAAQTEEVSSTARSLAMQANQLQLLMGRFTLPASAKGQGMAPTVPTGQASHGIHPQPTTRTARRAHTLGVERALDNEVEITV